MRWLATFCFFLSGASGLVFETVWTRQLGLIFGSTTLAIATVLSVFMGGLAVGSAIAGRYADRLRRPLLVYALAELGVGAYGLAIPLFLRSYPALNTVMWRLVGDHPVELSLLRFAATALLLLVPTALMGATLPLLSRHLVARAADYGRIGIRIGELYAANTLGAVAGTFVSGFVLLPMVGVQATNRAASFANIGLAVVIGGAQLAALASAARRRGAALLAKVRLGHAAEAPDGLDVSASDAAESEALRALPGDHAAPVPSLDDVPDADDAPPITIDGRARRVALVAFAFSGAAAMVYQVLWSRALAIVIGSSVYSFTIILLAFLIGLSIGAALWSRLANRSGNPVAWLAATHLGVVAMVIASYLLLDKLPGFFVLLLQGAAFSTDGILFTQFLLAALAVLPATVFLGGVMPLTIRIYSAGIERVGHDVGQAYSVNTVGAIVGSFAAGFVVLPRLGLQRGLFIAALVSTCVASALVLVARGRRRVRWPIAVVAPLSVAAMMAFVPRWDLGHFQAGLFRISIAKEIVASGRWLVPELLYYHDGISTTVSVERWGKHIALKNNGKVDASNGDDMPTH